VGTVDREVSHVGTVEPAKRIYEESYVVIEGDRGNVFAAVIQRSKIIFNWSTVEPRSIVPVSIVFPHIPFAIFGPE
jgi:hypothetical protein